MKTYWQEALDIQLEINTWLTSDRGRRFGGGWFISNWKDVVDRRWAVERSESEAWARGSDWAAATGAQVFNAEPIYVDEDMMTVVEAAVDSFRMETVEQSDLITPNGLLILPRSLWLTSDADKTHVRDADGNIIPVDDLSRKKLNWKVAHWDAGPRRIKVTLFHDDTDPDELDATAPDHPWIGRWIPTHAVSWPYGAEAIAMDELSDMVGAVSAQVQLQAIWRLLNQTLTIFEKSRPSGPFLKRAQRARLPKEHVTIVRLRRPRVDHPADDEPKFVNWTHRWIVGGHWRWQWYRDDSRADRPCGHRDSDGRVCMKHGGTHRQIWISPYQKGPDDLPLVVNKARVFALVR